MAGGVSRFLFSIPQERNRLEVSPVAKILSRILLRQTLPFWQCIQILARSISGRTDDARRRIELNATDTCHTICLMGEFNSILALIAAGTAPASGPPPRAARETVPPTPLAP